MYVQYHSLIRTYVYFTLHACKRMAPQEILKYSCYMFAWNMSCVAPCVVIPYEAISFVVVSHVVIAHVPFYRRHLMTMIYMSGYYAYIASSYIRTGHTQVESVINLQNPVNNCG